MKNKLNNLTSKEWLKFQKSWFIHNPPPRKKGVLVHPAKFPETMAQEFIEFFTREGETVLDPMAGTGSTLVAALRSGRNSYGIELNPKYAQIARQIIEEERQTLGSSIENLKSEIVNGDARLAAKYQIPTVDYMLTCYDDQTEILTEEGWILFSKLRRGVKVATLEEGKYLRFREPLRIIKAPYNGSLYSIQTKTIDLKVTPDHNMYIRKRRSKMGFQLIPARQIIGKEVEYKLDAEWEGEEQTTFYLPGITIRWKDRDRNKAYPARNIPMDSWLEFLGYWITEGSVYPERYSIDLATTDAKLALKFMQVIAAIGESPNYYQNERVIHIKFSSPSISKWLAPLGHAHEKYIPRPFLNLCKRQLRILYDSMMAGDGDKVSQRKYWTSSPRLKDDFQELLLKLGYAGISQVRQREGHIHPGPQGGMIRTNFPSWTVGIWKERLTPRMSTKQIRKKSMDTEVSEELVHYQGTVYCVQVPSGIVYVRRNGKGVWCGNSPPYWDMLRARGAMTQKKRRSSDELDVHYSDDPNDMGNISDYEEFLAKLVRIYEGLKPLLREKAYLTIIVKNVKKGGKIYPLAWDIARELGRTFTLKDEKIWLQDNQSLAPYGLGSAWVSNTFHHYCLQFRKE
jgi:DNA modification methylase